MDQLTIILILVTLCLLFCVVSLLAYPRCKACIKCPDYIPPSFGTSPSATPTTAPTPDTPPQSSATR